LALKDIVFRKYQRRRASAEDVESLEQLLRSYGTNA
jgi:N-acetylglutamate synthase-like GNAT family acetyltransferase